MGFTVRGSRFCIRRWITLLPMPSAFAVAAAVADFPSFNPWRDNHPLWHNSGDQTHAAKQRSGDVPRWYLCQSGSRRSLQLLFFAALGIHSPLKPAEAKRNTDGAADPSSLFRLLLLSRLLRRVSFFLAGGQPLVYAWPPSR
ncbi:hypothetical protein KCP73_14085 [Salmonella enterica subsp. enterica]|nr:hypothetical protein KCP73_14085 [Salmonella enterica subsp. enterica]